MNPATTLMTSRNTAGKNTDDRDHWIQVIAACCSEGDFWNPKHGTPAHTASSSGGGGGGDSKAGGGGGGGGKGAGGVISAMASGNYAMAALPQKHSTKHHGEPWYVGTMDRETCKKAVTSGDPGDYLIRDSSDGKKMVIVVAGRGPGETANYQVVPGPDFMYIVSGVPYKHVSEVLASMRTNHPNGNDGKPLPLANVANHGQNAVLCSSLSSSPPPPPPRPE
jgi:hypothetical protein